MKTVAIVGAGPSGLVAAKTLLRSKKCQYKVTIFEKTAELGGLWAAYPDRPYDGLLNPDMPTNVGRFNIGFADLAWQSAGLEGHVPYWPRAWQAGQYLAAYTKRYIPRECILYKTKVISASAHQSPNTKPSWKVIWETTAANEQKDRKEDTFDYLIVASGFFNQSIVPKSLMKAGTEIKVIHSTKLRVLNDVLPEGDNLEGSILVVGGGMSGADAATVLASQLSDSLYSPQGHERRYENVNIVQLCPEPAYALPLAAACDNDIPEAPHFLPLDLVFYRLDSRPPGPINMSVGKAAPELIKAIHGAFKGLVGDQSALGVEGLTMTDTEKAAYVTLTEQYSSFIRSGNIQIRAGRLDTLQATGTQPHQVTATYNDNGQAKTIDKVIGIVYATGFSPQPSLDFLSDELRTALEHDASHNRLPILLDTHAILHSKIPGLAVIGYHEGAFWGTMEMEARLVERKWSQSFVSETNEDSVDKRQAVPSSDPTEKLRALRQAMTSKEKDVPQYWLGDYVGQMEQLARETNTPRNDESFGERSGPVMISRYADDTCDTTEAEKTLQEARRILGESRTKALFVGRAAFLGLQGNWKINRTIISHLNTMPSGTLTGTASFHPRFPTDSAFTFEYLYIEQGTFHMSNGMVMNATRRYAYRYNEEHDKISVWFVKDDGRTVDYMFHGMEIDVASRSNKGWLAKADHLCIKDFYVSDYRFKFLGANVEQLTVVHEVKGPSKDYVSETVYVR